MNRKVGRCNLVGLRNLHEKEPAPPEASVLLGPGELWVTKHRDEGPG